MSSTRDAFAPPRVWDKLLEASEVEYLKGLFQSEVRDAWEKREAAARTQGLPKPRRMLEYFTLLQYLQRTRDPAMEALVAKLNAAVEAKFGGGYVIANDFWSWRSSTNVAAERVHMDADFWMTSGHDGFNLWILLDHEAMPHTFDVFQADDNPELYRHVGLPHVSTWLIPEPEPEKAEECPGIVFFDPLAKWPVLFEYDNELARVVGSLIAVVAMKWWMRTQRLAIQAKKKLPTWLFTTLLSATTWLTRLKPLPKSAGPLKATQFPVEVGDALVVRQMELHGTDSAPLRPDQFRLAVGFKFVRQGPVSVYSYTSPASKSRRRFPALRMPLGSTFLDPYRTPGLDMTPVDDALSKLQNTRFTSANNAEIAKKSK